MEAVQNDDVISPQDAVTLHGLFLERARRTPDKIAYSYFDTRQSVWVDLSWDQMREHVARWQFALAKEGLQFFYHNHGFEFVPHGDRTLFA